MNAILKQEDLSAKCLSDFMEITINRYLADLDGQPGGNLYDLVMQQVEKPLLEIVLNHTGGNQTRAAEHLGLNRATLRKRLREYNLI